MACANSSPLEVTRFRLQLPIFLHCKSEFQARETLEILFTDELACLIQMNLLAHALWPG